MAEPKDRFDKEVDEMLRKLCKICSVQELEKELRRRLSGEYQTLNDKELKEEVRGEIEEEFEYIVKEKYENISDEDLDRTIEYELKGVMMGGGDHIPEGLKEKIRERARRKRGLEEKVEEEREEMKASAIDAEEPHEEELNKIPNYMNDNNYLTKCARVMVFGPILLALLGTFIGKPIYNKIKNNNIISQITTPKKAVASEKKEECDIDKIYKEVKEFGKKWKNSECLKYGDEKFSEEMLKKVTYDQIKLRFKYMDSINKGLYFPNQMMKETERIPDQIQSALNLNDLLVIFCDKNKTKDKIFFGNSSNLTAAYYDNYENDAIISVPHSNNGPFGSVILHEVGHAFKDTLEKKFRIYCPHSLYKIFEMPSSGAFQDARNDDEFFANLFSFYYGSTYYNFNSKKKESFKKDFPEPYNFFRKLESLIIERSLQENWIDQSIEKEERDKRFGFGRYDSLHKWEQNTLLD